MSLTQRISTHLRSICVSSEGKGLPWEALGQCRKEGSILAWRELERCGIASCQ